MLNKLLKLFFKTNRTIYRQAARLNRKYRLSRYQKGDQKILEISGGRMPLSDDYLNVDILDAPEVDVVTDINGPLPFESESADVIISVATLEHFNLNDMRSILKEFHRILKIGGRLEIGVPSLHKIMERYRQDGCTDEVLRYMHGAQKDQYDIHLCILDAARFMSELSALSFKEVKEEDYDFERHDKRYMMKIIAVK
ncbi:MAG: methyltransferase domain-containing protein [Patescibacteria group bacterium]|nr:methyltransferase domain-containing protein [Patescibacteria group bacterium]